MRSSILLLGATLLAVPAGAQTPRFTRAFEPSVTPWLGIHHFGDRAWMSSGVPGASFSTDAGYSPSLALGVMLDAPLTRRLGLVGDLHVAPLGKQEHRTDTTAVQGDRVVTGALSASLAWRFRPQAPVFFFGGPALMISSKPAVLTSSGAALEPAITAGIGIDVARTSHVGARLVYQTYWVKPGDPNTSAWHAQSHGFDWTLGLGARVNLHGGESR